VTRGRLVALLAVTGVVVVAGFIGVVVATSGSSGDRLVVYTARSHYGEEQPFKDFARKTGNDLTLFGGTASELYERIRSEGSRTRADVLITVDGANLWRAKEAGLLRPVRSEQLQRDIPRDFRDPGNEWFGLTLRARTIMRSTKRVGPSDVTTYAGLGDPRWKGKLCLRNSASDYNVSFVADRIAKDGHAATEAMLRRWMANDPTILGSDTDVLHAIEAGRCDVGLTNSYYLGRELEEHPDFPVAPVWADQKERGTHVNLSGIGVLRASKHADEATALVEFLTRPSEQQVFAHNNHEFAVDPDVKPTPQIARFGSFKRDPIDVAGAGEHLSEAVRLMNEVGWN
jgi:iron(III) transport system substrate-binding protein